MERPRRLRVGAITFSALILLSAAMVPGSRAAYPTLPSGLGAGFLSQLSAPVLAPGDGGAVTFLFGDPMPSDLLSVHLTLAIYAFNGYPGNSTGGVPDGALTVGSNGTVALVNLGTVVPGAPVPLSVSVGSSSSAPSGTYAIRIAVDFVANGTAYHLASRGEFTDAEWAQATTGPNGTSTLNLSLLGVSGIVPETAVLVHANPYPLALTLILAAAFVLAGAGGYYAFRRGPGTRSGAGTPEEPSQAETALGKSRKSDGD